MNGNMDVYKPNWRESRQRLTDWWAGKPVDRAIAQVRAPLTPAKPLRAAYLDGCPAKYTDFDTVFNNLDFGLERTFWGGELLPWHFVYLGPMFNLTFLGCEPNFTPTTTWYEPIASNLDELLHLEWDRDNRWWLLALEMVRRSAQRANGSYLTSGKGISSIIDTIAGLLGNENLLVAMAEEPDKLKAVRDRIAAWGEEAYAKGWRAAGGTQDGTIDWMGIWSPGKVVTAQCDFCVMISPEMFRDFVKEDLESSFAFADHCVYHLDGEEQIRHLDILLSIEKLKLIQWVPSERANQTGYKDPMNWLSLFKRIQEAGKSVLVYCPPERVAPLLRAIDPGKVVLNVCCPDQRTAEQTLLEIERIGV